MNFSEEELTLLHTCVLDAIAWLYSRSKTDCSAQREIIVKLENLEQKVLKSRTMR